MTNVLAATITNRAPSRLVLAAYLSLACSAAWAAPVTAITTQDVPGTATDTLTTSMVPNVGDVTLHYSGLLRRLTSLSTGAGTYGPVRGTRDVVVYRNPSTSNAITLRFERTDGSDNEINLNAPAVHALEDALRMGGTNLGADNLFTNEASKVQSSNVERVDFLFAPTVVTATQLTSMVIPVFDRATAVAPSDAFKIAVLRGADGHCTAPVAGGLVSSRSAGDSLDHPDTIVARRDPATEQQMRPGGRSQQGIKGQVFTLQELGVAAGDTVCGFALFGGDATGTDPADATQNPPDTLETPNGGLDLVSATGLFELNLPLNPPVANDDAKTGQAPGSAVTLDVVGNDTDPEHNIDPTSVTLVVPPGAPAGSSVTADGKTLTVPGEGTWTVDPMTGVVTFTPAPGFAGNPTPIQYTVRDHTGLASPQPASITVTYAAAGAHVAAVPVGPWAPLALLIAGATAYARRRRTGRATRG